MNTTNDNRIRDAFFPPPAAPPGVNLLKAILKLALGGEKQPEWWRCEQCGNRIRSSMSRGDHQLISHRFGGIGRF